MFKFSDDDKIGICNSDDASSDYKCINAAKGKMFLSNF